MKIDQKERKAALLEIKNLINDAKNVLIIHYSCESFYERPDGTSPKITSIAIRNLSSAQTKSFSIHKEAELQKKLSEIENNYVNLEKEMLKNFYDYIDKNKDKLFVHWNMRDDTYGFGAIAHRYKILGGEPIEIPNQNKKDLALLLHNIYGKGYVEDPKLKHLVELNNITEKDFLSGAEEAEAFVQKEYIKLHYSTLRKVDILSIIIDRVYKNILKTNTSYWEQHGGKILAVHHFIHTNIYMQIIIDIFLFISFVLGFKD